MDVKVGSSGGFSVITVSGASVDGSFFGSFRSAGGEGEAKQDNKKS
jgi:hypothetical protein